MERPSNKYDENPTWKCDHHKSGSDVRNLIVCIDGTANQFGKKNTNVIELYNLILKEEEDKQLTWYNSGIGTYARPSWRSLNYFRQVIDHKIDLAIAWNFERTILAAYRWLSENYQKGDRIYLFGFSRGAFQVRVLSAMIDKVGLIRKGNEEQIPFAYELYADPESDKPSDDVIDVGSNTRQKGSPENQKIRENPILAWFRKWFKKIVSYINPNALKSDVPSPDLTDSASETNQQRSPGPQATTMAARFKKAFSHNGVHVHYIGVWDTVSSIGIARGKQMLPGTVDGMKHVCYFRQALALDERRVKFAPEYAYGGFATPNDDLQDKASPSASTPASPPEMPGHDNRSPPKKNPKENDKPPHTLEVWFAGTHSDIGGGNAINEAMDRSRPPLRCMVFEAASAGLRTEPFQRVLTTDQQIEVEESLTGIWWLLEVLPINRLTYTRKKNGRKTTYKPHFGAPRKIHPGQKIHGSLILTNKQTNEYTPKALPLDDDPDLWSRMHTEGLGDWKAVDLFEGTQDLLNKFADRSDDSVWEHLRQTANRTVDGRQATKNAFGHQDIKIQLIRIVMNILNNNNEPASKLAKCDLNEVREVFADCKESNDNTYISIARRFLVRYTTFEIQPKRQLKMEEFTFSGCRLATSSNDRLFASNDVTYHSWESEVTGATEGYSFNGNSASVISLAVSPDGNLLVSGLMDGKICFRTSPREMPVVSFAEGHTGWARSVAFSPTGERVVSGGDDRTVRIWDVAHGTPIGEPIQANSLVHAVTFTDGGKHIMSLSDDQMVRVWDMATRTMVGEPLRLPDHLDGSIYCGAFSSDGRGVIVGSGKGQVMVWNLDDAPVVGKPCLPHEGWVSSVAFSPDKKYIASASGDGMVHVSDTETQELECTLHHQNWVWDVSFLPDGKRVASACNDGKIRIWDVEQSW